MRSKAGMQFAGYKDLEVYKLSYKMSLEIFEETLIVCSMYYAVSRKTI